MKKSDLILLMSSLMICIGAICFTWSLMSSAIMFYRIVIASFVWAIGMALFLVTITFFKILKIGNAEVLTILSACGITILLISLGWLKG